MTEEMRQALEVLVTDLTEKLNAQGVEKPHMPDVLTLTDAVPFAYVPYSFDSQIGIHPNTWAADQLLSVNRDGTWQLHPDPPGRPEQAEIETYGLCAQTLLHLLAAVESQLPEAMIEPGRLDAIHADLSSIDRQT